MTTVMTNGSIHKDPRGKSPYWYCAFYSPEGKRCFKSTKCSQQGKALKICLDWKKAALAGRAKTLTEAQTCRVLSEILEVDKAVEAALHEEFTSYRMNGEWFSVNLPTAMRALVKHISDPFPKLELPTFPEMDEDFPRWFCGIMDITTASYDHLHEAWRSFRSEFLVAREKYGKMERMIAGTKKRT